MTLPHPRPATEPRVWGCSSRARACKTLFQYLLVSFLTHVKAIIGWLLVMKLNCQGKCSESWCGRQMRVSRIPGLHHQPHAAAPRTPQPKSNFRVNDYSCFRMQHAFLCDGPQRDAASLFLSTRIDYVYFSHLSHLQLGFR